MSTPWNLWAINDRFWGFAIGETPTEWLDKFKEANRNNKGLGNIWQNSKTAWSQMPKYDVTNGFFSRTWNQIKPQGWVDDFANFSKNGSKFSAGFKCLGKRMPLIGSLIAIGTEIPNLYRSFTDTQNGGGLGTGLVETGKTTLKLGAMAAGFAAGSAIGTALFPGVGTVVGGIIGFVGGILGSIGASKLADCVLGKSFTEKKEEKQEKIAQQQKQMTQMGFGGMTNPFSSPFSSPFSVNPYDMYGIDPFSMSPTGMYA